MSQEDIGRLWQVAMDTTRQLHDGVVPKQDEKQAWTVVFRVSHHLLRQIRCSGDRLPKPPGLEEMEQEARTHLV